jgi:glycosyltransferase involved in cell wall biosynthesis
VAARVSARAPHQTIVVSRTLRQHFRDAYQSESHYVPNGVDMSALEGSQPVPGLEPGKFVLFLGRLVPEKQVHVLIKAFMGTDTSQKLALAGPSSNSDDYVRQLDALAERDKRIVVLGPRYGAEKGWLMRNASVFVQPSTVEGLPIALLEAMACGRYAVVSDIPENIEAATPAGSLLGRSFRTGDASDLSAKLVEALADPERDRIGAEGAALVSHVYDWDRIAERTERVYAAAIAGAPKPALGSGRH